MKISDKVNVLGTEYAIVIKNHAHHIFSDCDGYCDRFSKEIVLCDFYNDQRFAGDSKACIERILKKILRHEITHAFLDESGLMENSYSCNAWAENEEMVDWFAIQGPKIYKSWKEAGAL